MERPTIREIGDTYLSEIVKLDPIAATYFGLEGATDKFGDYSPAGNEALAQLNSQTLKNVRQTEVVENADRIAKGAMIERLTVEVDSFEQGEYKRNLNVIASPLQEIRQVFDLMPCSTNEDFGDIAARLGAVEKALAEYRETLSLGLSQQTCAPARQVIECARQAHAYANTKTGYFAKLGQSYTGDDDVLARTLSVNASKAAGAYESLASYLENDYLPNTSAIDFIGEQRWALMCRTFNGLQVDPAETYQWGWEELHRIDTEMSRVAQLILPGSTIEATIEHLENKEGYVIHGEENFRVWNQNLIDATVAELNGKHFNIPDPVKVVEAMIAPPGGAAAMYYTQPSADFSRPGRTWYPTLGRETFPLWTEVSTAYHEGVPGHHLQFGYITYLGDKLNSFSRLLGTISGYLEGWALYAERLMDELGYLEDPVYKLGMLSAQGLRAARVVVDIGLHHQFKIPTGHRFLPAQTWTPELAVELIHSVSGREREFAISEVDRYLGWPAQATSYKIGERVWLETREASKRARGSNFSLPEFHQRGFELGFVGLNQLREELSN